MEQELEILKKYLKTQKIDSEIKEILPSQNYNCLEWNDAQGLISRVYNGSLLIINNEIHAYHVVKHKDSYQDTYSCYLMIVENNKPIFKWDLIQEDRDETRFDCLYLGKHEGSIIHVHKHALHTSILSYKNKTVTRFHSVSELINRKEHLLAIERVQKINREKPVELIKLPELIVIGSITYEEAKQMDIQPIGNYPLRFLYDK